MLSFFNHPERQVQEMTIAWGLVYRWSVKDKKEQVWSKMKGLKWVFLHIQGHPTEQHSQDYATWESKQEAECLMLPAFGSEPVEHKEH